MAPLGNGYRCCLVAGGIAAFFRLGAQIDDAWALDWQVSSAWLIEFAYVRMNVYFDILASPYFSAAFGPMLGYVATLGFRSYSGLGFGGGSVRLSFQLGHSGESEGPTTSWTLGVESDLGGLFSVGSSGSAPPLVIAGYLFLGGQYTGR